MRSETTADISDSMAPSMAIVTAGDSRCSSRLGFGAGTERCGNPLGMPPNCVPIVSMGMCKKATAAVAPKHTTIAPSTFLKKRPHPIMIARHVTPTIGDKLFKSVFAKEDDRLR
jgi:hypothetical protein